MTEIRQNILATLSLFTSTSTLVCCALPAAIVTIAGGAVMAGIATNFPALIWLSERKLWLFAIAGIMLAAAGLIQWKNRNAPCPADPVKAAACTRLRKINAYIYGISIGIYMIGFLFAFVFPYLI